MSSHRSAYFISSSISRGAIALFGGEFVKSFHFQPYTFSFVGTRIAVYCSNGNCQKFLHVECCERLKQNAVGYFNRNKTERNR